MTLTPSSSRTAGGDVELIAELVLAADAASIDFQNIAGSYRHLRLLAILRCTTAADFQVPLLRLNGDAGANYDHTTLATSTTTPNTTETMGATAAALGIVAAATADAGDAGVLEIVLPYYAQTTFRKYGLAECALNYGTAAGEVRWSSHGFGWRSTAAIDRVTLLSTADDFLAGSRAALYGVS